jgi:hypothetical protein
MTIETSPANDLFAGFNDDEKKMLAVAIRRVEELEETRRITATMAGQAQAIESDLKARGVDDAHVLREAAEAVAATATAQGKLAGEVQDYRKLFGPDGKAAAAVGQYTQLLRNAHAGDVDALNLVQSARRELYEARDASAQERGESEPQGRYEVRAINPSTLMASTVLATDSALAAHAAFDGKADREVFDRESKRLVGTISWEQDGSLPAWKMRPDFAAAVQAERPADRAVAGDAELANTIERDDPERTRRVQIERNEAEKLRTVDRDDRVLQQDLASALPASFAGRYVREGNKLVDAGNAEHVILVDKGAKLQVPREFDAESVKATVDVAEARGWESMKVSGDAKFRQAVYIEAASRGIEVKGYNPSEAERQWAKDNAAKHRSNNMVMENDVAKAFNDARTPAERRQAAEKHPELKKAFAIEAAYSQLAKQIHGKAGQDAFMARMRDNIATDLAQGRELADVRLRKPMFKDREFSRVQDRDQDRGR